MTTWGDKLAGIDEEQLRQQLCTESDAKAVKRLTNAVLYKQRKSPAEIEKLLGSTEQIVCDWLDILAEHDLTALGALPRPGQSTRLTDDQWRKLTTTLAASPSKAGNDEPAWTPALVGNYIAGRSRSRTHSRTCPV